MAALPAANYIGDGARTEGEGIAWWEQLRNFTAQLMGGGAEIEATVAGGVCPLTQFLLRADTEGEAGTDNLDQFDFTHMPEGGFWMVRAENPARVNTLRHLNGTGNPGTTGEMVLDNGANFALDAADKFIVFYRKGDQAIEFLRSTLFGRRIGAVADAAALRTLAALAGTGVANTFTARQAWSKGADIVSAATLVIGADGNFFGVTGATGPITAMTVAAGTLFMLHFAATPTLTSHPTNLNLGVASITAAAGDRALFFATGANQVALVSWQRASGQALAAQPTPLPRSDLAGLGLSNNSGDATNDIDIAAGACRDSTNAADIVLSALTKRLDAGWAPGTNEGMRNSAAAITDTTYHIYAVAKALGADPEIYAHASATIATVLTALQAETGGADYIYARRIGSILREGDAIVPFVQSGDHFRRKTVPALDVNNGSAGTSANTGTLKVPLGIVVEAQIRWAHGSSAGGVVSALDTDDQAPSTTATPLGNGIQSWSVEIYVFTNASGQIRYRLGTNSTVALVATGWKDRRGRDD